MLSSGAAPRLISKKSEGKDGRSRKRTYKFAAKLKPYAETIKTINKDKALLWKRKKPKTTHDKRAKWLLSRERH